MKTNNENFTEAVDNFLNGLVVFIKQLLSVHLYINRNGSVDFTGKGVSDRLIFLQQQVVQRGLDEMSLEYGLTEAARTLAVKELIKLDSLFNLPALRLNNKIKFDTIYENIAIQYCVFLAVTKNMKEVFNGDFDNFVEDAYQESYFMVSTFFNSFDPSDKAKKDGEALDNNLHWKFLMYTKGMLPSKLRHWYLKYMRCFRYNRKPKVGQKRYEKVLVLTNGSKAKKTGWVGTPNTIIDKYSEKVGDQSYSQLLQLVKEKNPQYADYIDKHFNERKTYAEIANESNTKENTVRSGVNRGIAYIKYKLNIS